MTDLPLAHRFVPATAPVRTTLLLLHGTGGNEHDMLPLGRYLAEDVALLSPRGAVREDGMPRFFRRFAPGVLDLDDLAVRTDELAAFVAAAADSYGLDPAHVVAVGFSNGANIAASLLLRRPEVLRAAVLFAPMLPYEPEPLPDLSTVGVHIDAGRDDPMAPAEQAERLAELLTEAGAAVELRWHDGGHRLDQEQAAYARHWLRTLLSATAADPTRPLP